MKANESIHCRAVGCVHLRKGFGLWCKAHQPKSRRYGHPNARPIRPQEYKEQVKQVRQLFSENQDHPGLSSVVMALEGFMGQASAAEGLGKASQPYPSAPEVARLVRHGVTARELLETLAGHLQWQKENPHALPSDEARDFALSHALLRLAPMPRRVAGAIRGRQTGQTYGVRPSWAALKHLGRYLRTWVADFLAVVFQALEQREQLKEKAREDRCKPLKPPVVAFLQEEAPRG